MTSSVSPVPPRAAARRIHLLLALVPWFAAVTGCTRTEKTAGATLAPAAPAVVVRLAPVTRSDTAVPVQVSGVLARRDEAALSFKVDGVVDDVLVRAGDRVKSGQVLARLRLDEIEARVAAAQAGLDKARRDEERVERLQAKAVSTLENLQDARTAVELSAAQVRIAQFNRRFAVITAPSDGHILRRSVEPDEYVAPGRPVLGFASDGTGWLARVGLAARDVERLRLGDRAEVGTTSGRISQISEAADPVTRTVEVEISLDAPPAGARSGSVAPVILHPAPVPSRPVVPASCLVEATGANAHLYIVDAGATTARRLPVEVEALVGTQAYLRTPLPEGARLVVQGGEYLRDGSVIQEKP
ncbi:MAG: efflux RND transporter periplasmic adaptor subunit [Opitutaceae bacterium]|nr:efflux RND transporter periplasmic adaptor subunit [Opitutaceae bacterium]